MQLRLLFVLAAIGLPSISRADQGDPVAIRIWPNGVVSVETQWNFTTVIRTNASSQLPEELAGADLVIACSQENQPLQFTWRPEHAVASPAESMLVKFDELDHYLDRVPNTAEQTFLASSEATFVSKNAVSIARGAEQLLMISVDGVRIALPLSEGFGGLDSKLEFDAIVLPSHSHLSPEQRASVVRRTQEMQPRYVLLDTPPLGVELETKIGIGNTFAISFPEQAGQAEESTADAKLESPQTRPTAWIHLSSTPWQMPPELSQLFVKKELACSESQKTFAKLSVAQLNFKPANGTHTPRWNAEHMMGRELGFFSQIYAQQTSEISPIDLNPKQMPPDYAARHADWDGSEEARQMQRVAAFTRRFAYLLDGLDLDQKAPGSSWTPRKLLRQMDAHYQEHTANVIKKFELPEWPKE